MESTTNSSVDRPATFQIKVQGRLGPNWSEYFSGMSLTNQQLESGVTVTTMTGVISDQAALHGLIQKIRDLGLSIIQIQLISFE
jgi:hypothetical protein